MPLVPDPVFVHGVSYALGAIFLAGAADKLRDRHVFIGAVQAYGLLPVPFVVVFSFGVMLAELAVGLALWMPPVWPHAQWAGLALLGVVTGAVIINLLRGHTELDCGCGGAGGDQPLSWGLVARNGGLAAALVLAAATPGARELVWLDYAMVLVTTASLFGLYAGANQLLANRPRLARLEGA
ncbi:MAG: MauE/DoxX family redox-associated membrane protein [Gammaproteobacteria bacterium]